jgi:hypothetical protein
MMALVGPGRSKGREQVGSSPAFSSSIFGLLIWFPVSRSSDRPVSESVAEPDSGTEAQEAQGSAEAILLLDVLIPRLAGSLVVTIGVGDFELLIWPADGSAPESVDIGDAVSPAGPDAPPVTWDASGPPTPSSGTWTVVKPPSTSDRMRGTSLSRAR